MREARFVGGASVGQLGSFRLPPKGMTPSPARSAAANASLYGFYITFAKDGQSSWSAPDGSSGVLGKSKPASWKGVVVRGFPTYYSVVDQKLVPMPRSPAPSVQGTFTVLTEAGPRKPGQYDGVPVTDRYSGIKGFWLDT